MKQAIAGLLATMADGMAIFAPNANSYRRMKPEAYVPMHATWGYNNRGVAVRVPVSGPDDRRLEHRVAGADANPYLRRRRPYSPACCTGSSARWRRPKP